jgi:hypothetical protein
VHIDINAKTSSPRMSFCYDALHEVNRALARQDMLGNVTAAEPSSSTGSFAEALSRTAPMRLKVGPSGSDTRDRSEEERPALQKRRILGTHVKKAGCSRSLQAHLKHFQPHRARRVDLT